MRLVIISNRLPVTVVEEKGAIRFMYSVGGGLSTGLRSFIASDKARAEMIQDYLWVGWPEVGIKRRNQDRRW